MFWASGSSYTTISHVAMYIGGGKAVQVPQSAPAVRGPSMWFGSDSFGAVRPTG